MYLRNSPFTHADKIDAPLLLIHGSDDQNPGTHVIQSERLYAALQGLGKHVRMVLLPCERHAYDALESVMHVVAEQDMFLTKYVVQSQPNAEQERKKRAKI
jgi:dipeptidyl aminopeptidase/acylaminoacyl peptidase